MRCRRGSGSSRGGTGRGSRWTAHDGGGSQVKGNDMNALDPNAVTLKSGAHKRRSEGLCVMEAVAWFAGEPHSDHPSCTCPVIAAFLRSWNDSISDDAARTALLAQFIPKVVGTRSTPEVEVRRAWMAIDWMVREYTPAWLDLAGLAEHGAA